MKGERLKHLKSFSVLAFLFFLALGSSNSKPSSQPTSSGGGGSNSSNNQSNLVNNSTVEPPPSLPIAEPKPLTTTAVSLFHEYQTDAATATKKYEGKVIEVTGEIQSIVEKDVTDNASIVIGETDSENGVQCAFIQSQNSEIAKLSKGQQVTIKGTVWGKTENVQLTGCILISP